MKLWFEIDAKEHPRLFVFSEIFLDCLMLASIRLTFHLFDLGLRLCGVTAHHEVVFGIDPWAAFGNIVTCICIENAVVVLFTSRRRWKEVR